MEMGMIDIGKSYCKYAARKNMCVYIYIYVCIYVFKIIHIYYIFDL